MKTATHLAPQAIALAVVAALSTPAQADWKETAKTTISDFLQGKSPKQVTPPPASARSDAWGEGSGASPRRLPTQTPVQTPVQSAVGQAPAGSMAAPGTPQAQAMGDRLDGTPRSAAVASTARRVTGAGSGSGMTAPAAVAAGTAIGAMAIAGSATAGSATAGSTAAGSALAGSSGPSSTAISTPATIPGDGWTSAGPSAPVRRASNAGTEAFPPPADLPFQYISPDASATQAAQAVQAVQAAQAAQARMRTARLASPADEVVERVVDRPTRRSDRLDDRRGDRFAERGNERNAERSTERHWDSTSAVERASRQAGSEAFLGSVSCTNVARAWEGAANAADTGRLDRAYAAYVKLLSACKSERELLGTVYQAIRHLPSDALLTLAEEPVMSSVALQDMAYELRSNLLFRFNRDKKVNEALKLGDELREQAVLRKDANVLTVMGYLEMQGKRNERAQNTFRAALRADRDHDKAREGLALTMLAAGKPDAAWREADRLTAAGSESLKASIRLAQARQAFDNNDPKETLKLLNEAEKLGLEFGEPEMALKAWSLKQSGQADKSSKIFAQLHRTAPDNKEYATGLVEAYRTAGEFQKIEKLSETSGTIGPIAQAAIADQYIAQGRYEEASALRGEPVEGRKTPNATALIAVRSKSGEAGAGRLTVTSAPEVVVSAPVGSLGRLSASIGSLRLSDGVNDVSAREARLGFATSGQTRVSGGLLLTTTLGNTRVGGELAVRRFNAGGFNQVMVARGPIYDSVRSFSGVLSPEGFLIGRANETLFAFSGNQTINADWKIDYNLSMGSVTGRSINSNGFYRAVIGGTHNLGAYGMPWLSAGPQMHVGGYREDQNVFDRAAGGYFSPKSDTGFGMKAYLAHEHSNRLILRGSAYAGYVNRSFNDFSESGVQLEGDVAAAYLLNDSLIGTLGTTMRSSPGYSDATFWMGITVPFEKRTTLNSRDVARPTLGIR